MRRLDLTEGGSSKHCDLSRRESKAVYRAPIVTFYGDLRTITQAVANSGSLDGAPFALKTNSAI